MRKKTAENRIKALEDEVAKLQNIKDVWYTDEYKIASIRVPGLSTHELLLWADTAGSGMCLGLEDYRRHGTVESLDEIRRTITVLQAVTEELLARHGKI